MALIVDSTLKVFDTTLIKKGYLLYAKHQSWPEGKAGFVTAINDIEIIVQYHPGIGNVTNHFFIRSREVVAGEWEVIRWSEDMSVVNEYPTESEGGNDS